MSSHLQLWNGFRSGRLVVLGTASSLAISMALGTAASAQETESPVLAEAEASPAPEDALDEGDVIVVSGYRAALENAQNIKRNSDTFVDVISAEDIGALADRSVAEALQRVPGVNISRFEQRDDPDRFSVEGTGVIIRGLPFVRSELNGRDIFSANGGRVLSFNDVSPELLGRVEVFKNTTADMVDGGISGTVNLVTRKPLDKPGFHIAGTIEANYGDLAKEWSPGFSVLGSTTYENDAGRIGVQLAYAQSELVTRTDASQLTDPCYRADTLDGPCIRIQDVGSGGLGGQNFDASNFPPPGTVITPKGAGVRTTDLTRDRNAFSAVLQYESPGGEFVMTGEYLRAETSATINEYAILALVNDDALFPVQAPGSTWQFDENGIFQSGVLTQGGGIPAEFLRFQREDQAETEDLSFTAQWDVTDRLSLNFEAQTLSSFRNENGLIGVMQSAADISIDATGKTPDVQFLPPTGSGGGTDFFTDPGQSFYWFLIDNQVKNEGSLDSFRGDIEYDVSDTGFFRKASFGARWAERNRVTRNANFGNWGNLSAPWSGGAVFANNPNGNVSSYSQVRNPFEGFQRGNTTLPVPGGAGIFFGGDNLVDEYLNRETEAQAAEIIGTIGSFAPWGPLYNRSDVVDGTFRSGEISDVDEKTVALYGRIDFGADDLFGNGWELDGNFGLRYIKTTVNSEGTISFPAVGTAPAIGGSACDPASLPAGQQLPGFCQLSPARQAEFLAVFNGDIIDNSSGISFKNWLPSFNAKLDVGDGLLFRVGVSKGIFRPDLALYRTNATLADNTNNLRAEGTLETGPLFLIDTGNRFLTATESWNYDLSAEWYWADVGSLTVSLFMKELSGIVNGGTSIVTLTGPSGLSVDTRLDGPTNSAGGTLKGVEVAYQQVYDFLPGFLKDLGAGFTYTYVDAGDFTEPDLDANRSLITSGLPLAGVSKHTVNAAIFYENDFVSARAAYNWRSDFLQTPRDVIFPFSPIYGEATGQLDASLFFTVMDGLKLGVQGVNLLDEVTETTQVVDFDGTRITRSAFRNDRRFTFLARFDF
ncbi:TonB-dependent receptor [Allopontixanthobacter sediminis]|nr:TonB-dependent receptor [Allopontixanthobacter sediminis]